MKMTLAQIRNHRNLYFCQKKNALKSELPIYIYDKKTTEIVKCEDLDNIYSFRESEFLFIKYVSDEKVAKLDLLYGRYQFKTLFGMIISIMCMTLLMVFMLTEGKDLRPLISENITLSYLVVSSLLYVGLHLILNGVFSSDYYEDLSKLKKDLKID